jgi:hypothetical protein
LIALDLRAYESEVLFDDCLMVAGRRPLVDIRGSSPLGPSTVRVRRSSLVAGKTLLRVHAADNSTTAPALRWLAWDALLAHPSADTEDPMVVVGDRIDLTRWQWQTTNCLFAGWKTFLKGPGQSIGDQDAWRRLWNQAAGDGVLEQPWPPAALADLEEIGAEGFRTADTRAHFAATSGPGALGCDVVALPHAPTHWVSLTYEPFSASWRELPDSTSAPAIPAQVNNLYTGEYLDLSLIKDLGAHLDQIQKTQGFGPRVVLHLAGKGYHLTSPIRIHNTHLVLYVVPGDKKDAPLVLGPRGSPPAGQKALLEIEEGTLEMWGVALRVHDLNSARYERLVQVKRGNLTIFGCRLEVPLGSSKFFQSLVSFEGGAGQTGDWLPQCVLTDSVLISGKSVLQVMKTDARVRMEKCLLLAAGDALEFQPGEAPKPALRIQCLLNQNTMAVKRAVIHLHDSPQLTVPVEPIVIQARANVFLDPFAVSPSQAGMLLFDGAALDRGLLVWQGQSNAYEKRLPYFALPAAESIPASPQPHSIWTRLWGLGGDSQPALDLAMAHTFAIDRPVDSQFNQLVLPPLFKAQPVPGADLAQLGLLKKRK